MQSDETLACASGVKLVERNGRLLVVSLGTGWLYTASFVAGLTAFIFGAVGSVQVVLALAGGAGLLLLGGIFLAVAVVAGVALWRLVRHVRARNAAPVEPVRVTALFDFHQGLLCTGAGEPLAPLSATRVRFKFQVASSSRALEISWPGGATVMARGNPFAGGLGPLVDALRRKGIPVG